jgi:PAS domain S-box-containing protein
MLIDDLSPWIKEGVVGRIAVLTGEFTSVARTIDWVKRLFDTGAFMPHGHCYLWNTALMGLHLVTDLLIGLAYVAISLTLAYFVHRAKDDIPFSWIFLGFGTFIIACGATHFMEVWTLWVPVYWLSGAVKLLTAAASVTVAILLPPLLPKSLALIRSAKLSEQSHKELELVNWALQIDIGERQSAAEEIRSLNADLEERVRARTAELAEANRNLTRDIAERRSAQEMLRLAVEAAPNAMVMVDGQGKIVLVNTQTEKLFGYSRQELIGSGVDVLVPQKYRDRHPKYRQDFMREPQARAMGAGRDLYGVRKDGSEFPVEIGLNSIQTDEGTLVLSAIVDITQRKQAEEEIQRLNQDLEHRVAARTAELTTANAELESFSYSVAHDLRAPIRQIDGFSRILSEEGGQDLDQDSKRYLGRIQEGARQAGNLVDDLLNLARVSRQALERRPTQLDELVRKVRVELETECASREIEWRIDDLWTARCDPALIKQVFINLLSNAVKFTRLRDRAAIHVGQTAVSDERVIFVRDNGAGFDMAYAGKLFGVFQRLHLPRDFEGTGVGLANVQRILQKHGGRIWAEAEPDKGATFFFTIPDGPVPAEP